MPVLDQPDEGMTPTNAGKAEGSGNKEQGSGGVERKISGPVSMPSLDDDNDTQEQIQPQVSQDDMPTLVTKKGVETTEESARSDLEKSKEAEQTTKNGESGTPASEEANANAVSAADANGEVHSEHGTATGDGEADHNQQQVAMELDEAMQAQVEGGQIKFILNENGQLLQLDNHIITDADGNQILVQDPEQIQQLLQSAGLLQSGDGIDGETLQMMTDGNGQMVLVQGDNNETQLIDASLLNADGQLVIQQGHDGELGEGAHVIGEDGTRIPVSVSYTADGQPIVRVQQQMLEAGGGEEDQQHVVLEKDEAMTTNQQEGTPQVATDTAGAATTTSGTSATPSGVDASVSGNEASSEDNVAATGGSGTGASSSGGGDFFPLEDLMQQSAESKPAE